MPSFDSGYYAFTALIPLLPDDTDWRLWRWSRQSSSVPHSLRELLSSLPTVDVPAGGGDKGGGAAVTRAIPFSGCDRTHFARLVVVEELAWNGREGSDTLLELLWGALGWFDHRPADRLPCPYLLVLLDFDAPDGSSASVEDYLLELWPSMEQEWTLILSHCLGFDPAPGRRSQSYVELMLRHEIDSTFPYTGYAWAAQQARLWDPATGRFRSARANALPRALQLLIVWLVLLLLVLLVPALVGLGIRLTASEGRLLLLLLAGLALLLPLLWSRLYAEAFAPWPAQPGTDLRSVLKALFLQSRFLELVEQSQRGGTAGNPSLRRRFRQFLEETQPHDVDVPSLRPGSIPTIRRSPQP